MAPDNDGTGTQRDEGVGTVSTTLPSRQRNLSQILHDNMRLVSKAVSHRESRLAFGRVLRTTAAVRSQLNRDELKEFFIKALRGSSVLLQTLLGALADETMHDVCNHSAWR